MAYRYSEAEYAALLSKSKYSMKIAEILCEKETLKHEELRNALNIKPNNLSNVIRKIEPFDILFIRKIGKNVYYSLSPKGYEFYEYVQDLFKKPVPAVRKAKKVTDDVQIQPEANPLNGAILLGKK